MVGGKVPALELAHPPSIAAVSVHLPAAGRKAIFLACFVALHSFTLKICVDTSGQAYEAAVERVRRTNREHVLNGTKPEDRPPQDPLPSSWAPNPWASAALFGSLSLHALFHLLCHWGVQFKTTVLYKPAQSVHEGCYLQVTPHPHRGKPALAHLHSSENSIRLGFTFQRQRYEYWEPADIGSDDAGEVRLVQCPIDKSISSYLTAKGLESEEQVDELKEHFGDNVLEVETPSFLQCYKEQLLTPLVIFQVFVALLWMADDFIQYTLMQIIFILVFESTSVMQRLRTFKMLNSMGTKPYGVQVHRSGRWVEVSTADLLPGDLLELATARPPAPAAEGGGAAAAEEPKFAPDIVPCDCVIVRGEAVASEASLTGESAPQMKDALILEDRALELQGTDRVHCLFSGTQLLRASEGRHGQRLASAEASDAAGAEAASGAPEVPPTPDGGCLCFVVRTGFASSQGELLQMIEFSQEKVAGDTREVVVALLVLLAFALVAAGYVLKTGLEKGEKTPHELLLKCVIILTAVVPRQLPMQMAVAVNTALMALLRSGVYCTEPFRVPLAGKLTHCLFDKTGTLTTDTLLPVGVVNAGMDSAFEGPYPRQVLVKDASPAAALVLATCHSLVAIDGKLSGDPIEVAALDAVGWHYDAEAESSRPSRPESAAAPAAGGAAPAAGEQEEPGTGRVRVLRRFHFASHLQRMAVVAEVSGAIADGALLQGPGRYCLVKGSPEALRPLLAEGAAPPWFAEAHLDLAEKGLRILALALRRLPEELPDGDLARESVETGLSFAGFIAFECLARTDSALVIGALRESSHQVAMVTGDSPLTALHIARTCGIADGDKPGLLLKVLPRPEDVDAGEAQGTAAEWVVATGERRGERWPLSAKVAELEKSFALLATGEALEAAVQAQPELWEELTGLTVYARMTPQGKAAVIRELQRQGRSVLMCGDGGNDVGALKQADVGLALLAGHGNVNTTELSPDKESDNGGRGVAEADQKADKKQDAEALLNERQSSLTRRSKQAASARQKFLWEKQKELNANHKAWLEEECEARARRGETGIMAQAGAVKVVLARITTELKREMKEYDQRHGNVYDAEPQKEGAEERAASATEQMEKSQGLPMVRPGDASVAAPFTSKAPSVKNCVDLIRQGRCTLLSALQQQQIMMLNCIINAYVLSALSLEGSRSSERQMMASHWLLTTASLSFAYASPCDRMHPVRPLRSLFHPAVFLSLLGQAAIHLFCMVTAVKMARSVMEEGSAERVAGWTGPSLKEVSEFWRRERLKRRGVIEKDESEEDWSAIVFQAWAQPFLPNLMNTVVFLVETAQTVAILFVNYKGQPWMRGVTENRALFLSVFIVAGSVAAAAWEFSPELNGLIHLSPFPDDRFRWGVMALIAITLVGTLVWDRLCVALFAPEIFRATLQSARQTTFMGDVLPIFKTAGKVLVVFAILGTGNLIVAGLAFYWYRKTNREDT